jgi:hypothetical protein
MGWTLAVGNSVLPTLYIIERLLNKVVVKYGVLPEMIRPAACAGYVTYRWDA